MGSAGAGPLVFGIASSQWLADGVCEQLGLESAPVEERTFVDGEHKARPLESVRGGDVYVIATLDGEETLSVNDKLCRLLFFLATLRDHGAARVTAVVPYLAYARKDRRTKLRDPVTTRYVGQLFEAVGVDRVVALEVHNRAAFDNAFRCPTVHLDARGPLADAVLARAGEAGLTVVSPDAGGVKRAAALRETLASRTGSQPGAAFVEKYRSEGVVSGAAIVGDCEGRVAVIVDDLIAGGTTMLRAARGCREQGASAVVAAATHAVFTTDAVELLGSETVDHLLVTDSVAPRLSAHWGAHVERVSVQPLLARAIAALAEERSVDEAVGRF